MTVYDNLGFGLRCRRVARRTIRARIREVAERLRVADILHRQPAELSGGQRQRVALGRAWVGEAGVLLLDEPMSHLDAQHRERMRRELLTHLDQGPVTTLYVTHDQEEALALGQRVAVMNAGGLQQVGTPAEVYRYPANRFVAEFLGMPTMNFIEGEIVRGSAESLCFRTLDGDLPLPDSARSLKLSAPALVVLGVRPQDLHFTRQTSIPGLPFYVEAMAFQGSQTLVYLKTPQGTPLTLCTASDTQLQVGQRGICTPVMDRIHLFAPGPFGENLLPPTHPVP
jgi:multiple sugar transport system ATP-binding protein